MTTALALAALTATALGACSGGAKPKAAPISHPTTTQAAVPTPQVPNPLTGVGVSPNGPVIAVKVDDTAAGRPSLGLDKADVIYISKRSRAG